MPDSGIFALLAIAETEGALSVPALLLVLVAALVSAKLLGELAERIGQPAVLGELVAGVLIGSSVLGIMDPAVPTIHLLAEIGIIILLFQIGLETDLKKLLRVGPVSLTVAVAGVVLPFAGGYYALILLGLPPLQAAVGGAALTATSVGITSRVLSDLGRLQDPEGQIVLGAAIIDDVVGLVILAVIAELVSGISPTAWDVTRISGIAFGFIVVALLLGRLIVPPLFGLLARLGRAETLATMALTLAFLTAVIADSVGSALIVGAFAAGLVLHPTPQAHQIEEGVIRLGQFFVPIFFVAVGAAVDVRTFLDPRVLGIGLVLIVIAVIGKLAAGYAPFWYHGKKLVIGMGMVPRGEVGLIFAQMGLAAGVLDAGLFSTLALMVLVTTFMAPPALKRLLSRGPATDPTAVAQMTTEA